MIKCIFNRHKNCTVTPNNAFHVHLDTHLPLLNFSQEWRSQALPTVRGHLPSSLWAAQLRAARGEPLEGLSRLRRAVPSELPAAALREARPHTLWRQCAQLRADRVNHRGGCIFLRNVWGKCVLSARGRLSRLNIQSWALFLVILKMRKNVVQFWKEPENVY